MNSANCIEANTWEELQEALYYDDWLDDLSRYRSKYVYRGVKKAKYQLTTSLNRLVETHLEKHLLRNFVKYSQISERKSVWNWLALAQHHGLPTRLLDWTYSPLVALHFATDDFTDFDTDGMIWAINYPDAIKYLPSELTEIIAAEGSHVFTAEMLDRGVESLDALQKLSNDPFPLFFEPPSIDGRIVNQYSVFSMMSQPDVIISQWLEAKDIKWFKIPIKSHLKWKIRDRLDQANINERVLFPGLDGLAAWLKRHYIDVRKNGIS